MVKTATVKRARSLRRTASVTEKLLWEIVRDRRLEGLKFRRQMPIGPYVADFVCLAQKLILEADGPFHDPERDALRDAFLSAQGFTVLRFSNSEIHAADHRVAHRILAAAGRKSAIGDY